MLHWTDDRGTDPSIDEEHHRLYELMNKLEPVIAEGHGAQAISSAVERLYARLVRHFDHEEALAEMGPENFRQLLSSDHKRLLSILGRLRGLAAAEPDVRRVVYDEFIAALARHDDDVDTPAFTMTTH